MSLPLILACFWALAAGATAMLPMRRQYVPGLVLLVAAPVLIVWMGVAHGWWVAALGFVAFLSMFRNPLFYLARKAAGKPVERPEERA
jgi:ACR3 family arsenite efflux pump ArsB